MGHDQYEYAQTGRFADSSRWWHYGLYASEPCPIRKPITSNHFDGTGDFAGAKYSDIDINGHVNSIRYIEHILDLFPMEMYREKRIRRFEMAYVTESHYGDELNFFMDNAGNDMYDVEVKNGGEVVCRSKVIFTKK